MDAVFYNESGDKYYSGRSHTIVRNSTGAAAIGNVPLRFQILSDDSVQISWSSATLLAFTTTAAARLIFSDIPQQFIGTVTDIYHIPILANDGVGEVIGVLEVHPSAQTMSFGVATAGVIGNFTVSATNNSVYAGSVVMPRLFA